MHVKYAADYLADLPALAQGQTCDLKMDDGQERTWLSRCGLADGMPYENTVTVERLDGSRGRWETVYEYDGGAL